MENVIANVNFAVEIIEAQFQGMAVVKSAPNEGILVWTGDDPTEYGRSVVVRKDLGGGNFACFSSVTVGNIYYLDVRKAPEWITVCGTYPRGTEERGKTWREVCKKYLQLPVIEACRELGVTKLRKHDGHLMNMVGEVTVEYIKERTTIYIDL